MGSNEYDNLSRSIHPIPDFVVQAIRDHGLEKEFGERPAYQRNDYVGWISRAKREETRTKRLNQMLDELRKGGVYMKMDHPASKRK